jgi:hypothetical protein
MVCEQMPFCLSGPVTIILWVEDELWRWKKKNKQKQGRKKFFIGWQKNTLLPALGKRLVIGGLQECVFFVRLLSFILL